MILNTILTQIATSATPDGSQQASPESLKEGAAALKAISFDDLINDLAHTMVNFAISLAVAILVFYAGKFIIRRIYSIVTSILIRRKVDRSLSTFVLSLVNMVLYFILIVTVIGILGINTSSFIALFASAGVAVGMALSGTLQNFAGGVLILLLKPYKVGDYIEAQGFAGTVTEIQIFSTIICTYDNKSIIIPNGVLSTSSINNWSREAYRRIDWTVSLAYGDDFNRARTVILDILDADPRIVKTTIASDIEAREEEFAPTETPVDEPASRPSWFKRLLHMGKKRRMESDKAIIEANAVLSSAKLNADRTPKVFLSTMAESSINITIRAWALATDYWNVFYDINELLYSQLPQHDLHFPFPQLDVHLSPAESDNNN
ncbi:MAG: mechanosensitive ion channel [Bacteroides sp.]|nr:mechanosensitive ion channel [Bacteroides sp.]MCM1413662.1 mechanosensitive ion channel [Bacteroides sp.]MCM1471841.1 mechanosensitive ion channel [Bacteroides sp.]